MLPLIFLLIIRDERCVPNTCGLDLLGGAAALLPIAHSEFDVAMTNNKDKSEVPNSFSEYHV